ncbi:SH3 domain-containing protein [Xanthomonadaceae bacterium XH05]|nr:SH3 domain-containing protein [Xanthomonadaceae bacterium XH05]
MARIEASPGWPRGRSAALLWLSSMLLVACATAPAPAPVSSPASLSFETGVPGVTAARMTPDYWIARAPTPESVVLDGAEIAAQNARLNASDRAVLDLAALPDVLDGNDVRARIESLSSRPQRELFDVAGTTVPATTLDQLSDALALETITAPVAPRFGLVVRRADLRTFPTTERVFSRPGDTDIDRFQESALFPGTPVAVLHESRDGAWWFVASRLYSAWIEARHVALAPRAEVFDYTTRTPYLVVTGAQARTVFTPEAPAVSDLVLDMGLRIPLMPDWPPNRQVNGQFPLGSHVVALPIRSDDGGLEIAPALVPRSADVRADYLPLTRANLLQQSFKFLGERYGWGHSYGTRDCSGFVSEVYRSFGIEMPRNTRDQGVSTAFDRIAFTETDDYAARVKVLRTLDVGDLIYIPGHVMMVIGHDDDEIWLIHDTSGMRYRDAEGRIVPVRLNQVAVTPLLALLADSETSYVDLIYSIQRIRRVDSP